MLLPERDIQKRQQRCRRQDACADRDRPLVDVESPWWRSTFHAGLRRAHPEPGQRPGNAGEVPGEVLAAEAVLGRHHRSGPSVALTAAVRMPMVAASFSTGGTLRSYDHLGPHLVGRDDGPDQVLDQLLSALPGRLVEAAQGALDLALRRDGVRRPCRPRSGPRPRSAPARGSTRRDSAAGSSVTTLPSAKTRSPVRCGRAVWPPLPVSRTCTWSAEAVMAPDAQPDLPHRGARVAVQREDPLDAVDAAARR